jgi:hypothetical protein
VAVDSGDHHNWHKGQHEEELEELSLRHLCLRKI